METYFEDSGYRECYAVLTGN